MLHFVTTNSVLFNLLCLWILGLPRNLHVLSQQIVFFLTFYVFGSWAYQEICMLCFVTTNSVLFNLLCVWILPQSIFHSVLNNYNVEFNHDLATILNPWSWHYWSWHNVSCYKWSIVPFPAFRIKACMQTVQNKAFSLNLHFYVDFSLHHNYNI